ncbi:IclR family transcriptional regulator (plasmid) [Mesorhizobium sp. AR07]|uniref:IclR family transcriptional regulator n=1 Tax=Mesorhizobium sp. AR07 TaxID=2865838 RepID=UPI00215F59F8|nr:IclR family transcriptional regulator [Mesorhizobium sp. AR07]UVK49274.1 IclR family transcriptional regulator [Mesorhizobium sp. AR07]
MTVASVSRCLALLELLAGERELVELSELASRLNMPVSAIHRLVTALVNRGWLIQDIASKKYALSLKMSTLAFRNLDARNVSEVVQSVLNRVATETHECCRLAVLENRGLVWMARAQGATTGLRYDPNMGQEIVLHATASGKAWLGTLPEEEALAIVYSRGFDAPHKLGPNSAHCIDEFRLRLAETRQRGFATSVEEGEAGTAAIAVPFRASSVYDAPVAGTVSVAGPLIRITPDRWPELADALNGAAKELAQIWPAKARARPLGST